MEIFADMKFLIAEEEYKATGKIDMGRGADLYKRFATKRAGGRSQNLVKMVTRSQELHVEMKSISGWPLRYGSRMGTDPRGS